MPRAAQEVPAPKERDPKHAVKQSISLILFEFTAFVSGRSGHCTGTCRCREAHGKDCSRQSFCISSIPGGQIVRERPLHRDVQVPRSTGIVRERPGEKSGLALRPTNAVLTHFLHQRRPTHVEALCRMGHHAARLVEGLFDKASLQGVEIRLEVKTLGRQR